MSPIPAFLSQFSSARLGILVEDIGPPRAALIAPTRDMTPEIMNRALSLSGGLTFVAVSAERAAAFMLPEMSRPSPTRSSAKATTTVDSLKMLCSVEAREGITTGISASDRAATVRILGGDTPHPRDLVKPGHIFPVEVRSGGVLVKAALAEGALDIVRLAGFSDAALFVDLVGRSGDLLSASESTRFAAAHGLPVVGLSQLISYRLHREPLVTRTAEAVIPSRIAGELRGITYRSKIHDVEHIALIKGDVAHGGPVLVRVQAESTLSDVFGGGDRSSRALLQSSLQAISERGSGVLVYLRRPAFEESLEAEQRVASGGSQPASMMREYGVGAQILRDLGVSQIEVLSSSSRSLTGLASFGLTIVSQQPLPSVDLAQGHLV
jgi:3,4-dihydroxy 2-butanone 4-phosphate synthase/GTP cyclohydrolase II